MPRKAAINDELRKVWEQTIRAAVAPGDYKIKDIDSIIPVADHKADKEEIKVEEASEVSK